MTLLWPGFLFLLLLIPLLVAAYIWALRRKRRFAVRFSSLSLVRAALPEQSRWRRHLPFALFLLAVAGLSLALARPVAIVSVPSDQTTIILTMDVSYSMRANDIPPNRLEAAQEAANQFIERQQARTRIGLVAFAGFAELIQPPTSDQEELQTAVESLTFGRRTAIGSAILKSIDAIAEIDKNIPPSVTDPTLADTIVPVPKGAYAPDIIVVLTDGVTNAGVPPLEAAQQAADRGIRVYTIGYGTANGSIQGFGSPLENRSGGGEPFGDRPRRFRVGIDETTLKRIAEMTGGEYYSATSADEIQEVFKNLPVHLVSRTETTEVSFAFVGLGVLLAAAAVFLSQRWNPTP
jgi:Ca-activated chloride channel family protein